MKLSINIRQTTWEAWFVSSLLVLCIVILLAVNLYQGLDIVDVTFMLSTAFINFVGATLVGLRKY